MVEYPSFLHVLTHSPEFMLISGLMSAVALTLAAVAFVNRQRRRSAANVAASVALAFAILAVVVGAFATISNRQRAAVEFGSIPGLVPRDVQRIVDSECIEANYHFEFAAAAAFFPIVLSLIVLLATRVRGKVRVTS